VDQFRSGIYMVDRHLPDYREKTNPLDTVGLILFGSGIALLSYVLEVFGEHRLSAREILGLLAISLLLLAGYGLHAAKTAFPLLELSLFRIRTFRASVNGSFFTRLGIGGIPFIMPLLYQVGLGFTPIQSGLLMMPQAIAAISLKMTMPRILALFGYRVVLISNTVMLGLLIMVFATIGADTPLWLIVAQTFCFGFFSSLQYTSMNTLVYADISGKETSSASSIASTMQQLSISFGVAATSLVIALFIPDRFHVSAAEMIRGIHRGFFVLGGITVLSTAVFAELRSMDGETTSQHKVLQHAEWLSRAGEGLAGRQTERMLDSGSFDRYASTLGAGSRRRCTGRTGRLRDCFSGARFLWATGLPRVDSCFVRSAIRLCGLGGKAHRVAFRAPRCTRRRRCRAGVSGCGMGKNPSRASIRFSTTLDRIRLEPFSVPRAVGPWQSTHSATNRVRPRSAAAGSTTCLS
jgi:hypothetical protein